jgi:hypothetical protein
MPVAKCPISLNRLTCERCNINYDTASFVRIAISLLNGQRFSITRPGWTIVRFAGSGTVPLLSKVS